MAGPQLWTSWTAYPHVVSDLELINDAIDDLVLATGADLVMVDTSYANLAAAMIATPTNGTLEVRGTYSISSPFVINKACTVRFTRGASITATSGHGIDVQASGVILERPKVIGSGSGTAGTACGIRAIGTVGTPITDLRIVQPNVSAMSKYGIYLEQVTDFSIDRPAVTNIAYGGIMMLSCLRGRIAGGAVRTLTMPSGFTDSYGIAMTRDSSQSIANAPRSANITIDGVLVSGVTQWEGISTHGGTDLIIVNNIVQNCNVGISLVACPDTGGTDTYAPQRCLLAGNIIDAQVSDGSRANGIRVVGAGATPGAPVEAAMGCTVAHNAIVDHGNQASTASGNAGAILAYFTQSLSLIGNTLIRPGVAGIQFYHSNTGATFLGNIIEDAWTNDAATCAPVYLRSSFNTFTVGGTRIIRGAKSATIVNGRGLWASITTSNEILETASNNWAAATTATVGVATLLKFQITAPLVGFYGVTPVAKAASPGTAAGTDAAVINAISTALRNLGLVT